MSPQWFPGPLELLILARKKPRLVEDKARLARRELGLAASAELAGRYRRHQDLVGRLVFSTFDALRYRSLLVWLIAMLAAQFIAAFRVLDFVMDLLEPRPLLQERRAA